MYDKRLSATAQTDPVVFGKRVQLVEAVGSVLNYDCSKTACRCKVKKRSLRIVPRNNNLPLSANANWISSNVDTPRVTVGTTSIFG